jgi:hypothetical protein
MVGIVYTINDDLTAVEPVDPEALLSRLRAWEAEPGNLDAVDEHHELHRAWLRKAALVLADRTSELAPGTPIAPEDWHLRDLERLRRVAARAADHLLGPVCAPENTP